MCLRFHWSRSVCHIPWRFFLTNLHFDRDRLKLPMVTVWRRRGKVQKQPLEVLSNKNCSQYSQENACAGTSWRLQHRWFPVNIAKFLKTPISKNICERLLLNLGVLRHQNCVHDSDKNRTNTGRMSFLPFEVKKRLRRYKC